ncbi:hypothetical protein [Novosphingobium capsulatum]|uniref:hypothetical protein n=1 Tax=Novosphingobium capsulatum TaxID=13688 RepID=UPI0007894771|nr:hypothetical protein [Novosphingobium capsulatum]WQD92760.1 hypothetical protein U0041_17525 [Novosphingobium capsulatum]
MARYQSEQPVYLSNEGRYIVAGEEFTADHVPGSTWQPLDDEAKAAIEARDKAKDDAPPRRGRKAATDTAE